MSGNSPRGPPPARDRVLWNRTLSHPEKEKAGGTSAGHRKENGMVLVALPVPERQPGAACPACAKREQYRAHAAERFMRFETRFATRGVSRAHLRAAFAAHADPKLVESLLTFAWYAKVPAWRLRQITHSFTPRRCSRKTARCWLHAAPSTGGVAAFDAEGVVHGTD
jgi:hypothetical protein